MTHVTRLVMIIPLYINIKSLCHIPETNTMLYVNYTSLKKFSDMLILIQENWYKQYIWRQWYIFLKLRALETQKVQLPSAQNIILVRFQWVKRNTGYMYNVHSDLTSTSLLLPNWRTDALYSWFWKGCILLVKVNIVLFFSSFYLCFLLFNSFLFAPDYSCFF